MSCNYIPGKRYEIMRGDKYYPEAFEHVRNPPRCLYVIGELDVLREGLAIVGARKATPYGIACTKRFADKAARNDVIVISGGARGCDREAHKAALAAGGKTIAFLGGGCDKPYPAENRELFCQIVSQGGALISEQPWDVNPRPYMFRERNRLIAALAKVTLIVEAGLPSGTLSTADDAISANRDVCVVPGAITAPSSRGANWLLSQGALPIIDDKTFDSMLMQSFGVLVGFGCHEAAGQERASKAEVLPGVADRGAASDEIELVKGEVAQVLLSCPMALDDLYQHISEHVRMPNLNKTLIRVLVEAEQAGRVQRCPDGRYSMT
ncbi:DNA-processing protein DprA [Eggerthellaceae bacterium 3-80]